MPPASPCPPPVNGQLVEGAAGGGAAAGRAGRVAHSGAAQAESQGPCASGWPAWVQAEGPPRPPPHTDLALRAPRQAQRGPGEGECRPCGLEPWEAEGVPSSSCHVSSVRRSGPDITHSGRHQREHRIPASPATSPKKQTKRKKERKSRAVRSAPRGLVALPGCPGPAKGRLPSLSAAVPLSPRASLPLSSLPRWRSPAWISPAGGGCNESATTRRVPHRKALLCWRLQVAGQGVAGSPRPKGQPARPPSPGSGVGLGWLLEPSPDLPLIPSWPSVLGACPSPPRPTVTAS